MSDAVEGEIVKAGRPTKFNELIVGKFEEAFMLGFNVTEACQHAGLDRSTYYDWLEQDDAFSYRMSVAQAHPTKAAKAILIKAIQKGDASLALRYLQLRDPEFKPKAEITNTPELEETRQKLKDFLNDISTNDASEQPTATDSTEPRGEVSEAPKDIS